MASLNRVFLMGNLTRDPEIRYTPKGTAVADITLAINRVWTNDSGQRQEETLFIEVTLWGRQAELAQQYLYKGRPLFVEGRLQMDAWEDKQTGQKRSKIKIVAENIQLLGSARENPSTQQRDQLSAESPTSAQNSRSLQSHASRNLEQHSQSKSEADEPPLTEDDIPF